MKRLGVFLIALFKLLYVLALSGCDGTATASPSVSDGSTRSVIVIEAMADSMYQPALPDDFKKPDGESGSVPCTPAPPSPIQTAEIHESGKIIIKGYSPTWCSVCPKAKAESAASQDFTFQWESDESKFPDWVKKIRKYPLFYWKVIGSDEWRTVSGWKDLKTFTEAWRQSMKLAPAKSMAAATNQAHGSYPIHAGMIYDFEGDRSPSREFMIQHLNRTHGHPIDWLNSLTYQQLYSLHDDDHWKLKHGSSAAYSQPMALAKPRQKYQARGNCPNGMCPL